LKKIQTKKRLWQRLVLGRLRVLACARARLGVAWPGAFGVGGLQATSRFLVRTPPWVCPSQLPLFVLVLELLDLPFHALKHLSVLNTKGSVTQVLLLLFVIGVATAKAAAGLTSVSRHEEIHLFH
jgi:hypothetical protein